MPRPLRVLLVEDNPEDADLVVRELRRAGFNPDWQRVDTEQAYREGLARGLDIILSDYALPGFSGPRALEVLKECGLSIPFIIISGTIGEEVAVQSMKQGAADYLLKDRLARLGPAVLQATAQGRLELERRRNQEELRRTHAQLQHLLDHSPAVIYSLEINRDGVEPQFVSENITRLLGFPLHEAYNFDWWTAHLHPDDRERVIESLKDTIASGSLNIEYRLLRKDGDYVWVQDCRQVVRDAEGIPVEIAGVWTDITERKKLQAEVALQDQRHLQAAETQVKILNAVPANIALIDSQGVIVSVNESWRRFALRNSLQGEDCLVGSNYIQVCDEAKGDCSEEAREVAIGLRELLKGKVTSFAIEYPCHSPQERRWFRLMASPLGGDQKIGAVVMHVDVTERKEADEEIQNQLHELQRWHEAMLGREDRILELKSEVNAVLAQQRLAARYVSPFAT